MNEVESSESLELRRETSQTIARVTIDLLAFTLGRPPMETLPILQQKDLRLLMQNQDVALILNLLKISSESTYELLQTLQARITSETSPELPEWKTLADQLALNLDLLALLVRPQ
jgi:hypothetical protein